jgi:hypothetical protein
MGGRIISRPGSGPAPGLVPILSLACLAFVGGCDTLPNYIKEDIQEKRLAETGVQGLDPTGNSPSAGLSILRQIEVEPIDPREIGADTASLGFHRLVHRCGSCHATPSPKIRTAPEWTNVFSRMGKHMKEAGLIPLSKEDQALILTFLQEHAASR